MSTLSYSFPLSVNVCRQIIETSRENPNSKGNSRYLVECLQYVGIRLFGLTLENDKRSHLRKDQAF